MKKTELTFNGESVSLDLSDMDLKRPVKKPFITDSRLYWELRPRAIRGAIVFYIEPIPESLPNDINALGLMELEKSDHKEQEPDANFNPIESYKNFCYTEIQNWDKSSSMVLFLTKLSPKTKFVINVSSWEKSYEELLEIGKEMIDNRISI
jgi:hypothetical protein